MSVKMVFSSSSSWRTSCVCTAALLISLFLLLEMCSYSSAYAKCKENEVPSRISPCSTETTCNACNVCSPCVCKEDYIRAWPRGSCINQDECHDLHLQWLAAAKNEGKKNTFFNCDERLEQ